MPPHHHMGASVETRGNDKSTEREGAVFDFIDSGGEEGVGEVFE